MGGSHGWYLGTLDGFLRRRESWTESNAGEKSGKVKSKCYLDSVEVGCLDDLRKSILWSGRERRWISGC